jgi:AcrR family transcriptional regulator
MIAAAEQLIAERGTAALTLREVQVMAGQSNKSAAQYHFGSRAGLIEAVIEARMGPVNRRRWEMLESLDAASPRALVEALVQPLAAETLGRDGSNYARFLVQAMFDPALAAQVQGHLRADSFHKIRTRLLAASALPPEIAALRIVHVINLTIVTLAMWEGRTDGLPRSAELVADLVTSCSAVLAAPADTVCTV